MGDLSHSGINKWGSEAIGVYRVCSEHDIELGNITLSMEERGMGERALKASGRCFLKPVTVWDRWGCMPAVTEGQAPKDGGRRA